MATILFVHGYMNTGKVWDEWCDYFTRLGYRCYQPSWLYMERSIEEQQQAPDPRLAEVTFDQVVQHYIQQIEALDEQPILIGHSLGGVLVQKLVELGYAQAAICIHSGPPKGLVVWNRDFLWSNFLLTFNPKGEATVLMSPKWYHRYVTNDLTYVETEQFVAENCVPASRNIVKTLGKINFSKSHVPLLFIAGSADCSQPASINRKNQQAYTDPTSVTDYQEFEGRTHNVLNQSGWQEVAAYCAEWLQQQLQSNVG